MTYNEWILSKQDSIVIVGAHPDDAEIYCGGLILLARKQGIPVHLIIMTDGSIGTAGTHYDGFPGSIRYEEQRQASEILGVKHTFMGFQDGFLEPTAENRRRLIREVRLRKPSLIITHRLYSGHPDHRATGQLVRDSLPLLDKERVVEVQPCPVPWVWYMWDENYPPFKKHIYVEITDFIEQKKNAVNAHASQRKKYDEDYPIQQAEQWAREMKLTGLKHAELFQLSWYGRKHPTWEEYHSEVSPD